MHVWKVAERADAEMDGWRPVVCHRDRQRSIIYGGKSCSCFASVSHVKAYISDFSSRLALSLLQITHGDIFRGGGKKKTKNPQSEGCFFDLLQEFVRSQRWGRDHIAFMFNLRSAPTSKMHYLLRFCWFLSCSLWFLLKGHVHKRSLLLSLIPISLEADALGPWEPTRQSPNQLLLHAGPLRGSEINGRWCFNTFLEPWKSHWIK